MSNYSIEYLRDLKNTRLIDKLILLDYTTVSDIIKNEKDIIKLIKKEHCSEF